MKLPISQFITSILISVFIICFGFVVFEPFILKSATDTDTIVITQRVTDEISISSPADITMSQNISGVSGNENDPATGQATWTVTTNNSSGFYLTLSASTNPAMQNGSGSSFANFTATTTGTPDYTWDVSDGAAEFGYTVEAETAADTDQSFLDNGANTCNTGAVNGTDTCWLGFSATTTETIINRSIETDAGGESEVVKFRTEFNNNSGSAILASGTYTATITATATTN